MGSGQGFSKHAILSQHICSHFRGLLYCFLLLKSVWGNPIGDSPWRFPERGHTGNCPRESFLRTSPGISENLMKYWTQQASWDAPWTLVNWRHQSEQERLQHLGPTRTCCYGSGTGSLWTAENEPVNEDTTRLLSWTNSTLYKTTFVHLSA